jgi:hypothetical protein
VKARSYDVYSAKIYSGRSRRAASASRRKNKSTPKATSNSRRTSEHRRAGLHHWGTRSSTVNGSRPELVWVQIGLTLFLIPCRTCMCCENLSVQFRISLTEFSHLFGSHAASVLVLLECFSFRYMLVLYEASKLPVHELAAQALAHP